MTTKSEQTKQTLIQAASLLVITQGAQNLTLEAVAAAAGVSKGGLLYHFPSKEALIVGMIQHYIDHFEARLTAHLPTPDPTPEQWLRAYVYASFETDPEEDAISAALMAAVGINPHLLDPVRARYDAWQRRIDAAQRPEISHLIRLVIDGLWVSDLMGLAPTTPERRATLKTLLLTMIEE